MEKCHCIPQRITFKKSARVQVIFEIRSKVNANKCYYRVNFGELIYFLKKQKSVILVEETKHSRFVLRSTIF